MDTKKLEELLAQVQNQETSIEAALEKLRSLPFDDLDDYARIDNHRALRQGLPEVIFCPGKTSEQITGIMERMLEQHDRVMGTRANSEQAAFVRNLIPEANYDPVSRLLTVSRGEQPPHQDSAPYAVVVTGGTSDRPVAEEAAQTLDFLGSRVERAYDVGVAGLHRLLDKRDLLFNADVIISVAGMEGALTSVVGGLVACPVIGVPTSIGYGASFGGLAALLSMLNSCATGVAVVNIDNGFGAGVYAHQILRRLGQEAGKQVDK
ncbi:MAG TPA: nickel pincer cofactor biosynthesis protein LarB [Chloroflexi bacterium]|nr:nickel pincer cofactor biosynthesis protein LarB [Chloroflexota bacterium]